MSNTIAHEIKDEFQDVFIPLVKQYFIHREYPMHIVGRLRDTIPCRTLNNVEDRFSVATIENEDGTLSLCLNIPNLLVDTLLMSKTLRVSFPEMVTGCVVCSLYHMSCPDTPFDARQTVIHTMNLLKQRNKDRIQIAEFLVREAIWHTRLIQAYDTGKMTTPVRPEEMKTETTALPITKLQPEKFVVKGEQ